MKHWPSAKLGELTTVISSGATPLGGSENYTQSGPVLFIRSQNVLMNALELDGAAYISDEVDRQLKRTRVSPGDVLLNITGASIGRVADFCLEGIRANVNQHVCVIRPKPNVLFGGFLSSYISTPLFQTHINRIQAGGTRQALNFAQIANFEIPLPPMEEQRRIAAILDQAEALRAKRRAALTQLDSLAESIFLDLFGDPKFNERNWPLSKIGSVISDLRGGANLAPQEFVEAGFPILHKGAIKPNGEVALDAKKKTSTTPEYAAANRRCQVSSKHLAVTLRDLVPTGPSIGLIANLQDGPFERYLLAQGAYGFLIDSGRVTSDYLVALSNMPTFRHILRKYAVGSTQIHIRIPVYLEISIPLPPIERQRRFDNLIRCIKLSRQRMKQSMEREDDLARSLQHRAFQGEL